MDLGISGKLALVTGGSMGLGFGVCEALAAESVNLVLFARGKEQLEKAQADLRKRFCVEVETVAGDMTIQGDVRRLGKVLSSKNGPDILILNTTRPPSPMRELLDETDPERWERAYRTQLFGAVLVLQEITPLILKKGWGRIVAITSASVKQPLPLHALSTIFRAGLTAALKHLANETAGKGITVNSVCPASIQSESFAANYDLDERVQRVPLKRLGTVSEFAGTVAFFASQQAGYIHGTSIQVDGGMTGSL